MRLTDGVVLLRPPGVDDVEPYRRACLDAEVLRWTRVPDDATVESIREYLFGGELDQELLVIADATTDELLGAIGLLHPNDRHSRVEIGYWLAAHARGRGVMTRAVRLLADWALDAGGFARAELHIDPANAASRRVAEKAGFAFEAVLRGYEEFKGRRADVAMYAKLASGAS
jgi:ribosomal-protein-alanine N-acetyltransferase